MFHSNNVPAETVAVADPLQFPKQITFVLLTAIVGLFALLTGIESVLAHVPASVTVTAYNPAARSATEEVTAPLLHK